MSRADRSRRAPRALATTDVTRFRGVGIAAVAAAAVGLVAVLVAGGEEARRGSPGPLPLPHRQAGLACDSCHRAGTAMSATCSGCHGPHPSARPGHRQLAEAGRLGCADCHSGHGENGGVVFAPAGRALRYGPGGEEPVAVAPLFRPHAEVTVPIVTLAACARCHDPESPRDPVAACLVAGQDSLGRARPTVCFDEHRAAVDESGAARTAAWEAAREVAAAAPLAPASPRSPMWLWLGLGLVAAAAVWIAARAPRGSRTAPLPPIAPGPARLPVINAATCLGCYACVDACPYDVLEIRHYVAGVARPADCCGLTLCEQKCPNGSLVMADVGSTPAPVALGDSLESREVPGLYLAGDVTGLALIRNAINQGAHAVRSIAAARRPHTADLDLLIVGAGPAGLSAALEAQACGLRYLVLEQGSVADSIRSFPRGKLVLDPDLPLLGRLWLAETSKEELLAHWLRILRREQPAIREGERVATIERDGHGFTVTAVSAVAAVDGSRTHTTYRARHLLLAVGRRGTPRRLAIDLPPGWAERVHYSLADARSFAGRRVLVVGLGDVAMEAALALARQPGTEVVVSYRGAGFQRGKSRNIAALERRVAAGALRILWETQLAALEGDHAVLSGPQGTFKIQCDALLVFIGSIPPVDLLRQAGLNLPDQRNTVRHNAPDEPAAQIATGPGPLKPFSPAGPSSFPGRPEEARS